jgi:hypothetical protein
MHGMNIKLIMLYFLYKVNMPNSYFDGQWTYRIVFFTLNLIIFSYPHT